MLPLIWVTFPPDGRLRTHRGQRQRPSLFLIQMLKTHEISQIGSTIRILRVTATAGGLIPRLFPIFSTSCGNLRGETY